MTDSRKQNARLRVIELAADGRYRPFVIGYLLSCLDERHWEALVECAIEFGEANATRQKEALDRMDGIPTKRG